MQNKTILGPRIEQIPKYLEKVLEIPTRGPFYLIDFVDGNKIKVLVDLLKLYRLVRPCLTDEDSNFLANQLTFIFLDSSKTRKQFNELFLPFRGRLDIDNILKDANELHLIIEYISLAALSQAGLEKMLEPTKDMGPFYDEKKYFEIINKLKSGEVDLFRTSHLWLLLDYLLIEENNPSVEVVFGNNLNFNSYTLRPPSHSTLVPKKI